MAKFSSLHAFIYSLWMFKGLNNAMSLLFFHVFRMHLIIPVMESIICHKLYFHSYSLLSLPSTLVYEVRITILIWKMLTYIINVFLQPVVWACNYNLQTNIKTINVMGAVWVLTARRSVNVTIILSVYIKQGHTCVYSTVVLEIGWGAEALATELTFIVLFSSMDATVHYKRVFTSKVLSTVLALIVFLLWMNWDTMVLEITPLTEMSPTKLTLVRFITRMQTHMYLKYLHIHIISLQIMAKSLRQLCVQLSVKFFSHT